MNLSSPHRWLVVALAILLAPDGASAAPAKAAVVVTQAVGVGPLADHLANLASDRLAAGALEPVGPGEAARTLRERQGPDPLECGTDGPCLMKLGEILEVDWLVAVGIGKFGEMYGLEVSALQVREGERPRSTSSTFAAPGPEWEQALAEALGRVLPNALLRSTSNLALHSNVDGAEVLLDGALIGTTPMEAGLELAPGTYQLELRKEGHSTARRELELVAGSSQAVELFLAPVDAPGGGISLRTWRYVTGGSAIVAALAGAFFQAGASTSMDDARTNQALGRPFASQRDDAFSQIRSARILYGVAGAAVLGATTLYLLESKVDDG